MSKKRISIKKLARVEVTTRFIQWVNKALYLCMVREDTAYLEVQARDRLNFYREGERVLRFESDR